MSAMPPTTWRALEDYIGALRDDGAETASDSGIVHLLRTALLPEADDAHLGQP